MAGSPPFEKVVIGELVSDQVPVAPMNPFHAVGDVNGDGRPDVVVCGRNGRMVWFESSGRPQRWPRHRIADVAHQECGGSLVDLTRSGFPDVINGADFQDEAIWWWENPGPPGGPWTRRAIARTGCGQFHDTLVGDVAGDGTRSLAFTNQRAPGGTRIYRVPLPGNPRQSPWPGLELVAEGRTEHNPCRDDGAQPEEGLALGDVDGDGRDELIAGTHWYKRRAPGRWDAHKFAAGYITTKVAVGGLDGDGRNEIVLAESDPCVHGRTGGGRLAWSKTPEDPGAMWDEHVLAEGLLDAHTLQLGDLFGRGRLDILTAEVGLADPQSDRYVAHPPRVLVFENRGDGTFAPHVIDEGTGTHDALWVDMLGRGTLDVVGKALHDEEKWNVHVWFRAPAG